MRWLGRVLWRWLTRPSKHDTCSLTEPDMVTLRFKDDDS